MGQAYYDRCRQIMLDFAEAEQAVMQLQQAPSGVLKITAPIEFGQLLLGRVLGAFMWRYPQISAEVEITSRPVDPVEEGIDIAIIATDNDTSDKFACQLCKNKGIKVHVVGHLDMSDFDFPELSKKGDLVVGVTTGDKSPAASAYVRGEVDKMIPDCMEAVIKRLSEASSLLDGVVEDEKQRSNVLGMMFDYLIEKNNEVADEEFWAEAERRAAGMKINSIWDK